MIKPSYSTGENRLLHLTLEELNKQREAAGIQNTNVGTVYNKRVAEANAARANQPTRSTGTAVTDPATASMQRLRQTQEYLTQNPTIDPTGSINTQALTGQKLAEGYVAPRNMGNEEYYKTQAGILNAAQQVGKNAGLGLQSSVTPDRNALTGLNDPNIIGNVQAASSSGLEQSAIDNMRKNNYTEDQIRASLSDPARMENIKQTMSNTGLGGTARDSAVLTPAQAQQLLATSRNVSQRKQAQGVIDAASTEGINRTIERQVGTDKNGNPIYQTVTNPNYEKEVEAKRQRMAQDQANALKIQENTDKLKNFTAKVDTTAFTETQKQMNDALSMIKNLSPTLQAAVLPTLLSLQESNNNAIKTANELASTLPTDKEIESNYGTLENYILSSEKKMQEMADSNKQLQLDIAKYNKDALEIDKKLLDHDAQVAEQKQLQSNIENEKRLRRQLGKLGITTDVQGLNFLQDEVQKGVDSLNNLKTANNLVSLKAQLAIGDGYALDVRKVMGEYDANTLQIRSQTTEALQKVKSSISMDKKDRDKEMRSIIEKSQEKKDENAKEARSRIYDANMKMIDEVGKLRDDERAQEQMGWNRLESAITKYGSYIPQGIIDSIKKQLPDVDVANIAKTMTLAQMKQLKIGSQGGGGSASIGFPSGVTYGSSTPTYEEFVASKKESLKGKDLSIEDVNAMKPENLQKEYNAMKLVQSQNMWSEIEKDYLAMRPNIPKTRIAAFDSSYAQAKKTNDPEQAARVLDESKKPLSGVDIGVYKAAANVRDDLKRLSLMMEKVKDKYGPIQGGFWKFVNKNLSTDVDLQVLQSYQISILGAFARGVMLEKGVLNEGDITRAQQAMGSLDMSYEAATKILAETVKTSQVGLQNALALDKANGSRINDVNNFVMNYGGQGPSDPQPFDDTTEAAIDDFIRSRHK